MPELATARPPEETLGDRHADRLRLLASVIAHDGGPFVGRVQRALALVTDLLGLHIGILSRIEGDTYTVVSVHAPEATIAPGDQFPLGDTYCSITLDVDDLLEIPHVERSPHRVHPCYSAFGLESYVGAPIRACGSVWGTLNFSSPEPLLGPLHNADHDLIRLLAVWIGGVLEGEVRDTEATLASERLLEVVDHTPIIVFSTDADGQVTLSEGAGLTALGQEPGEVVGQSMDDLYADRPATLQALRRVLEGEPQSWESVLNDRTFTARARPMRDPNGTVIGINGVKFDVTEQKRAEHAIRDGLERFRAVTESAVDAIITTDARGRITSWNAAAETIFGHTAPDAIGQPVSVIIPSGLHDAHHAGGTRFQETGVARAIGRTVRLEGRRASGETFPLDVSLSSWGTDGGVEFAAILRDVTETVERQRALEESEERFRALSEASFEAIAFTEDGLVIDGNEQFAWLFGYAQIDDLVGKPATAFCAPEYVEKVRQMTVENQTGVYEVVCVRRDGSRFWAEVQGRPAPVNGKPVRITAIRDVTARKQIEEQRRFQSDVLAHVSDAVVALDLGGRITYWNAGAEALHGHAATDVLGRRLEEVVSYLVPDLDHAGAVEISTDAESALRSAAARDGELIYFDPSGQRQFISVSSSVLYDDDGTERGLLAVARDVTAQREMATRLRHQATHDVLTGLPNRALFRERIEAAIAEDEPFAVLFVDLDRFKVINDSLGHDAGDTLLTTVSVRLRQAVEAVENALIARLGGDEFGILVPTSNACPEEVGAAVLRSLESPVDLGPRAVAPGASVGVVTDSERYATPEDLLRDADTAMYAAKRGGRGRVAVFDPSMHEAAALRFGMEHDLRHAIDRHQLRIHLQPIVSLETGAVAGFESLVRWDHPDRGLLAPGAFVPLAEELRLIADLDRWVMDATCCEVASWDDWLRPDSDAFVSVNCSDQTFLSDGLADRVSDAAARVGLPPHRLILELTERALVDTEAASDVLRALRQRGIQLSLDDFGTGFSSLGLLHTLPVDGLKIDRSFVWDLAGSKVARAVVRSVVGLSDDLGLRAVAEGVETPGQLRALRQTGATLAQGYLFSRPVPPHEARTMLAAPPWADAWAEWTEEA